MYCNKCGKEISNDSLFCSYCGAKVSDAPKTEKNTDSLSCADNISGWNANHRSFLDENGLELISVFKGDFALAKSVGKDEFSVIKGENAPEVVSTAELAQKYDNGVLRYKYNYYDGVRTVDWSFIMSGDGFVFSEQSFAYIIKSNYVLTDSPFLPNWEGMKSNRYKTKYELYSVKDKKLVLGDFCIKDDFENDAEISCLIFYPGLSKCETFNDFVFKMTKKPGALLLKANRILMPDDNTIYGLTDTENQLVTKQSNFKDFAYGYDGYSLELIDSNGNTAAKFENASNYRSEQTDNPRFIFVSTYSKQHNAKTNEDDVVQDIVLLDTKTMKSVEAFSGTKYGDCTLYRADFNGASCPYAVCEGVTRLYNQNLELLTEIYGNIAYTFTVNNKLYTVNRVNDRRMGLEYTAVYNVNDDKECFRISPEDNYTIGEVYGDMEIHYYVNDADTESKQSPFILKQNGRQKAFLVTHKKLAGDNAGYGLIDLEGKTVLPMVYSWIDAAYENQSSGYYTIAVPANHIIMGINGFAEKDISLMDADGKKIITNLKKDDFDRRVEELFPECADKED